VPWCCSSFHGVAAALTGVAVLSLILQCTLTLQQPQHHSSSADIAATLHCSSHCCSSVVLQPSMLQQCCHFVCVDVAVLILQQCYIAALSVAVLTVCSSLQQQLFIAAALHCCSSFADVAVTLKVYSFL